METHPVKRRLHRLISYAFVALVAASVGWLASRGWPGRGPTAAPTEEVTLIEARSPSGAPELDIEIPQKVAEANHMAVATATLPTRERLLELRGSLAIDAARLVHVRSRFTGQIIDVASVDGSTDATSSGDRRRPLAFMDRVIKGEPMAVLWSKELGEKKSEMVDLLARLQLDRQALARINDLTQTGATSEKELREAEREVQVGENAVRRTERTLRSWEISDEDIGKVRSEVDRVSHHEAVGVGLDTDWARAVITAPIDGTIVERNVTKGDQVDTTSDLFKIADLSVLNVWLHAYEEDLPYLEKLPKPIPLMINLPANPELGELPAAVERIGDIIDPTEHMALLVGHVENPHGELRAGQFVTARIALAPEEDVVEIPTRALVEDGTESVIFVQDDPNQYRFQPRRVSVARRYYDVVHIRSRLSDEERARGLQELHQGERVAASETVQLKAALRQKQLTTAENPKTHSAASQP